MSIEEEQKGNIEDGQWRPTDAPLNRAEQAKQKFLVNGGKQKALATIDKQPVLIRLPSSPKPEQTYAFGEGEERVTAQVIAPRQAPTHPVPFDLNKAYANFLEHGLDTQKIADIARAHLANVGANIAGALSAVRMLLEAPPDVTVRGSITENQETRPDGSNLTGRRTDVEINSRRPGFKVRAHVEETVYERQMTYTSGDASFSDHRGADGSNTTTLRSGDGGQAFHASESLRIGGSSIEIDTK